MLFISQAVMAAPFSFDAPAKLMGFNSADTGFQNYTSFVFGGKERGAHIDHNYYWSLDMVSEEYYESPCFPVIMKSLMLFMNVYFFFIKFNALP